MKYIDVTIYKYQLYSVPMTVCYISEYAVSELCLSFVLLQRRQCFRHKGPFESSDVVVGRCLRICVREKGLFSKYELELPILNRKLFFLPGHWGPRWHSG